MQVCTILTHFIVTLALARLLISSNHRHHQTKNRIMTTKTELNLILSYFHLLVCNTSVKHEESRVEVAKYNEQKIK